MDSHLVWIIFVILFKYWTVQVESNNTESSPAVTDKTKVLLTLDNVAMNKQVTPTPITEMTTFEVTAVDETQRSRGADVIFVLCIVTSCGLMLLLLTLLSIVAIRYYRDKQDRDNMHDSGYCLNQAF